MADPDPLGFVRQVHAEAELLRAVAREADIEMAAIAATARETRQREQLCRERHRSRSCKRARELGEDCQIGVQPNPIKATNPQRGQ